MTSESAQSDHASPSDHELMARTGRGDRAAFALIVQRHQQRVVGLAQRFLGRWDVAEDVAQEVFLRVWRAAAEFQPHARLTTWLYRLAANLCWDRRRQAAREQRLRAEAASEALAEPPGSALENEALIARVRAAVQTLPDRQRLAVILHRYEGLSHREIAEATGWSASAVESCLVRAYECLRKSLSDMEEG